MSDKGRGRRPYPHQLVVRTFWLTRKIQSIFCRIHISQPVFWSALFSQRKKWHKICVICYMLAGLTKNMRPNAALSFAGHWYIEVHGWGLGWGLGWGVHSLRVINSPFPSLSLGASCNTPLVLLVIHLIAIWSMQLSPTTGWLCAFLLCPGVVSLLLALSVCLCVVCPCGSLCGCLSAHVLIWLMYMSVGVSDCVWESE